MTPNPIIRLQSLVHTLEQVIVPAVDRNNSLAMEQCGLVLAQLRMLIGHMPFISEYHSLCLSDIVATAQGFPAVAGGPATQDAAAALAGALSDAPRIADASNAFHHVGRAVEGLLRAVAGDGDPGFRHSVERAVLAFSERQTRRSRSWFRDSGFDPNPDELPEISEMAAGR